MNKGNQRTKIKVLVGYGTRPECIKLAPVILELMRRKEIETIIVSSGQHADLLRDVEVLFGIEPHIRLQIDRHKNTLPELHAGIMIALSQQERLDDVTHILVQGDTQTACAMAQFGVLSGWKVCHVEAGLRTASISSPFPEEYNRRVISMSAIKHYAPTARAIKNLHRNRVEGDIIFTGNTVIDAQRIVLEKAPIARERLFELLNVQTSKRVVLVTMHRRENQGQRMVDICDAIKEIARMDTSLHFIFPVHPSPPVRDVIFSRLQNTDNVSLVDPLPFDVITALLSEAFVCMTDSGGLQEEAPTFGVPVIVLRNETERTEGVESGNVLVSGVTKEGVIRAFQKCIQIRPAGRVGTGHIVDSNPYGDGNAAVKIVQDLLSSEETA